MKRQNNFLKTLLLAVALLAGSSMAWADGTISIPHNLGSFISLGTSSGTNGDVSTGVNLSNCKVDNSNTRSISETTNYFTIGNTGSSSVATFNVNVSSAADFIFRFKSGASGCSATMNLSLKNSGNTEVWSKTGEAINNTGSWDLTQLHCFNLGNLAAGNYTLTLTITGNTGSYAGNWGDFCFHTATEVPLPTSTDPYLNMVEGSFVNTRYNNDNVINYIRPDGYIDNLVFYNATAGYYEFNFKNSESNAGYTDAQIKLNVYDAFTGIEEGEYTIDASTSSATNKDLITGKLTTGWKKFRITFVSATAKSEETGETKKYLFNFANAYFSALDAPALPMYGTAVLDMSKGSMTSSSNPRYSSSSGTNNEISYIYNGGYADNFYVVIGGEEAAYYDLRTVTSNYNNKGGKFKVTITDIATNTVEINAQESPEITSNGQSIVMPLTGTLLPGLKRIRFDFVKDGESAWLFNIKDVSFYKRSLNEGYNYTAVAATDVDVVLTRSIKAGNWSTIVLPFDIASSDIETVFGAAASIAELSSGTENTLNFSTTLTNSKMKANQPYAIKVASDFSSKTINGVTIVSGTPTQSIANWNFVGTYSATTVPEGSYYFKSNKLYQRGAGGTTSMKPFRAYLTYTCGGSSPAPTFTIDGDVTGIAHISADGQMSLEEGAFYNLSGQRVAQPTRGLYIVNGRKVVIK